MFMRCVPTHQHIFFCSLQYTVFKYRDMGYYIIIIVLCVDFGCLPKKLPIT